jgi:general secretion pathway protein G
MTASPKQRGFTILELMVVISIIVIILAVGIPIFKQSILRAKETSLKNDLFTLRRMIDEYTFDKKKAPQALDDLVTEGYLKKIPEDPMTHDTNWQVTVEADVMQYLDQTDAGIDDVHSSSNLTSTEGTAYNSW